MNTPWRTRRTSIRHGLAIAATLLAGPILADTPVPTAPATLLHAARLLEIDSGHILSPGELLIEGERITAVGTSVTAPPGTTRFDLGDVTLLPGLIDAHVHLFLHPGNEGLQTVQESIPARTLLAAQAAKADLLAGFTAERDMGTEGAGSADSAVRNAINDGLVPGPRLRISGNAIDILGGHEDAVGFNPEQHIFSNATYANTADELTAVIRQQHKEGADTVKIYETGRDRLQAGHLQTPFQYTVAQLQAATSEARRLGERVAVHATGEPGTGYAAEAGVSSIEHASQLGDQTMALMKQKRIYAVPTFAVFEYFQPPAGAPDPRGERPLYEDKIREFKRQVAAGVPFAVGSDAGPFQHGTQARELELMVDFGMTPLAVLQADLLNGAELLDWAGQIGQLKTGFYADVIAVPGNPLQDIRVLQHVSFVMKNGRIEKALPAAH